MFHPGATQHAKAGPAMTRTAAPYEQILRPLYEARAAGAWAFAMLWCLSWGLTLDFGGVTIFLLVVQCGAFGLWRLAAAHGLARKKLSLVGKPLAVITTASSPLACANPAVRPPSIRKLRAS